MEVDRREVESEGDRALRIAWLEQAVAAGTYFVPAEVLARKLLRRLGLELLGLQHQ